MKVPLMFTSSGEAPAKPNRLNSWCSWLRTKALPYWCRRTKSNTTRIGPTGTPHTWWRNRPGRSCQRKWLAEPWQDLTRRCPRYCLGHRWRYGFRRVTEELRSRGMIANHERIARIMRDDNLPKVRHPQILPGERSVRAVQIYLNLATCM